MDDLGYFGRLFLAIKDKVNNHAEFAVLGSMPEEMFIHKIREFLAKHGYVRNEWLTLDDPEVLDLLAKNYKNFITWLNEKKDFKSSNDSVKWKKYLIDKVRDRVDKRVVNYIENVLSIGQMEEYFVAFGLSAQEKSQPYLAFKNNDFIDYLCSQLSIALKKHHEIMEDKELEELMQKLQDDMFDYFLGILIRDEEGYTKEDAYKHVLNNFNPNGHNNRLTRYIQKLQNTGNDSEMVETFAQQMLDLFKKDKEEILKNEVVQAKYKQMLKIQRDKHMNSKKLNSEDFKKLVDDVYSETPSSVGITHKQNRKKNMVEESVEYRSAKRDLGIDIEDELEVDGGFGLEEYQNFDEMDDKTFVQKVKEAGSIGIFPVSIETKDKILEEEKSAYFDMLLKKGLNKNELPDPVSYLAKDLQILALKMANKQQINLEEMEKEMIFQLANYDMMHSIRVVSERHTFAYYELMLEYLTQKHKSIKKDLETLVKTANKINEESINHLTATVENMPKAYEQFIIGSEKAKSELTELTQKASQSLSNTVEEFKKSTASGDFKDKVSREIVDKTFFELKPLIEAETRKQIEKSQTSRFFKYIMFFAVGVVSVLIAM